jgi:hypothetical protein
MATPLSEFDFFVAVYTAGDLTLEEMKQECQIENWAPVLILRTPEGIVVPLFRDPHVCLKFIQRNIPRGQMAGIMGMSECDTKRFTDKGWKIDWHSFPKMYTSRPGYQIDVEVIESDFTLTVKGRR